MKGSFIKWLIPCVLVASCGDPSLLAFKSNSGGTPAKEVGETATPASHRGLSDQDLISARKLLCFELDGTVPS